jgi:hypothetical protein
MAQLTALYRQTDVGVTEWLARRAVPRHEHHACGEVVGSTDCPRS